MKLRHLCLTSSLSALMLSLPLSAFAQVDITDNRTEGESTSTATDTDTADDLNVTTTGTITITSGAAITIDSDNNVSNAGTLESTDVNDTVGILVSGNRTGEITNTGNINLTDTLPTDGIPANSDVTQGSGQIGILISGGSTLTGNINASSGAIRITGQDSAGIRLDANASIVGNIISNSTISVVGERSTGLDIRGVAGTTSVDGDIDIGGDIVALGEGAQAINIGGDVTGGLTVTANITNTGYLTSNRTIIGARLAPDVADPLIEEGRFRQSGSALTVNANINQGIHFAQVVNDDGVVIRTPSIRTLGSAPAILIDGNGTPIAIGLVAQITDPTDENFDENLQYAFVNQGNLDANGLINDVDATVLSVADARLVNGINNTNFMTATITRSGIDPDATMATNEAHARVIVIGNGAIVDAINNSGSIQALGVEDNVRIYEDLDNPLAANLIQVTAIDISAGGSVESITNSGIINAGMNGRRGTAIAILDASGTLRVINNSGTLITRGLDSDVSTTNTTDFTLIAIDVRANTLGITINQTTITDDDGNENSPIISGDILLGSGDDTINIAGGSVIGDIDFGGGANTLSISNSSTVETTLSGSGQLELLVADNSTLSTTSIENISVTNASFDETSTYQPFLDTGTIDPVTGIGAASTLISSGTVTFSPGASITPNISNVLDANSASFVIAEALNGINVDLSDQAAIDALRGGSSPFLYNTNFVQTGDSLVLTIDLRSASELGLDSQQASLLFGTGNNGTGSVLEALRNSDDLGAAFVRITDDAGFNNAVNQLSPEFAASIRQFMLANVDGTTGAVGTHLQNARRSQDRAGGAWIEQFGYFADKSLTGRSDQFRGFGFGITGGFDTELGPFHTVGLNIGFASTEIEDVLGADEPLDILSLQAGLYAGYELGKLGIDLYAGGGYNDFSSNRNVEFQNFSAVANGDWSGSHFNLSANAGYDIYAGKKYFIRPTIGATYLRLNEKAYTENGDESIALRLNKRTSTIGTASAMLNFGARYEKARNAWWAPSARIGYRQDFSQNGVVTTGRFNNGSTEFSLISDEFSGSGVLFGLSLAGGSRYASFSLDYDGEIRDGFNRHTARLVVRLLF